MPIYKYTLIKYLKAYSTWVIVGISMLLVIVLGGYVPFRVAKVDTPTNYAVISVAIVAAITSFLSIFTSVFAGFKSAAMFKDEVEDGTFLVMLSKPITRSKIIFYKWLALQTAIIGYTFIVALSFLFAVSVFDTGHKIAGELSAMGLKTLRSQIIVISLFLWFILFVVSLIFSSIALLLSTKLTVGTTIGISIAIGVIIPITSLVGTFTSKPAYKSITDTRVKVLDSVLKSGLASEGAALSAQLKDQNQKAIVDSLIKSLTQSRSLTDNKETLYGLGLATNDHDTFKFAQAFDFSYQIQKLSEFASEQAIPEVVREGLDFSKNGQTFKTVTNVAQSGNPFIGEAATQMETLNKMILSSWKVTQPYRLAIAQFLIQAFELGTINGPIVVPSDMLLAKFTTVPVIKDDATKKQFLTEIAAPNSLTTWIAKGAEDLTSKDEGIRYRQANYGLNRLMNILNGDISLISFENSGMSGSQLSDFNKYFKAMIGYAKDIFAPLGFWTTTAATEEFLGQNSIVAKTYIFKDSESATHPDDQITDSLGYLKETLRAWDLDIYNRIASAVNQGYSIAKIKTIEYTNKFTILWIYLALALALVPVAYLVIRKQDFR